MKLTDLKQVFPPLLSIFILMNAVALFTTLTPLYHEAVGTSTLSIGVITAAYYLGMTLGSFRNAHLVLRIGHIRAFAAFASILTVAFLLNGIMTSVPSWICLRFVIGYCLVGLYIVIESWVLNKSATEIRGQALALYMIALNSASATGQFLLHSGKITSLIPFILAGILSALAIFPLAITKIGSPEYNEPSALTVKQLFKASPSGAIACFSAGLLISNVMGFLPLFVQMSYNSKTNVAITMFVLLLGSVILLYPLGRLSDKHDRRKVLIFVCITIIALSASIIQLDPSYFYTMLLLIFLFGGVVFTVYPMSVSHACDVLSHDDIVAAAQGLLLIYGLGAVIGPLLTPFYIDAFGKSGIFLFFITVTSLLSLYLLSRIFVKKAPPQEEQQSFIPVPQTTPIIAELDPRSEEENK